MQNKQSDLYLIDSQESIGALFEKAKITYKLTLQILDNQLNVTSHNDDKTSKAAAEYLTLQLQALTITKDMTVISINKLIDVFKDQILDASELEQLKITRNLLENSSIEIKAASSFPALINRLQIASAPNKLNEIYDELRGRYDSKSFVDYPIERLINDLKTADPNNLQQSIADLQNIFALQTERLVKSNIINAEGKETAQHLVWRKDFELQQEQLLKSINIKILNILKDNLSLFNQFTESFGKANIESIQSIQRTIAIKYGKEAFKALEPNIEILNLAVDYPLNDGNIEDLKSNLMNGLDYKAGYQFMDNDIIALNALTKPPMNNKIYIVNAFRNDAYDNPVLRNDILDSAVLNLGAKKSVSLACEVGGHWVAMHCFMQKDKNTDKEEVVILGMDSLIYENINTFSSTEAKPNSDSLAGKLTGKGVKLYEDLKQKCTTFGLKVQDLQDLSVTGQQHAESCGMATISNLRSMQIASEQYQDLNNNKALKDILDENLGYQVQKQGEGQWTLKIANAETTTHSSENAAFAAIGKYILAPILVYHMKGNKEGSLDVVQALIKDLYTNFDTAGFTIQLKNLGLQNDSINRIYKLLQHDPAQNINLLDDELYLISDCQNKVLRDCNEERDRIMVLKINNDKIHPKAQQKTWLNAILNVFSTKKHNKKKHNNIMRG